VIKPLAEAQTLNNVKNVFGVKARGSDDLLAIGTSDGSPCLLFSLDNEVWSLDKTIPIHSSIHGVSAVDRNNIFLVGQNGLILHYY